MENPLFSRLIMLGSGPETRGSIASVVDAFRAHGVFKRWPVDYIATRSSGGGWRTLAATARALRQFVVLLFRHRRAVLHVHSAPQASFWIDCLFMALAVSARSPVILQLHGGAFDRFYDASSELGRAAMRFFLERASCVVVPSESLRHWVRSITREVNVRCIPSPVLVQKISRDPCHPGQPNMVLFLGRLEATKGIFDLLEAISALRSAIPDVHLVCAGEGDRQAVARYAERLGIGDAVKFTGWVGPSGKRTLLENAAAFVLPSYTAGLPVSLLEAMAAGVPVIASPVGGIPEVVVDGVSGFLVAPGDTQTLQRLLRKLLVDRKLAERIGAAARESVRLRFSPERTVPQIEALYASLGLNSLGMAQPGPRIDLREAA
jgi:glycosyltransferase involved in cell wall biosynthesis